MTEQTKETTGEVRVLTRAERNEYNGMTIEAEVVEGEGTGQEQFHEDYIRHDRPWTYRVHTSGFGWPSESRSAWLRRGSWQGVLMKLALAGGLLALALFFFGVVLPVLLVAFGLAAAGALVWKFLR